MENTTSMISEGVIKRPSIVKPPENKPLLDKNTNQTKTSPIKRETKKVEKDTSPVPANTQTNTQGDIKAPTQPTKNAGISPAKAHKEVEVNKNSLQPYQSQENTNDTALDDSIKRAEDSPQPYQSQKNINETELNNTTKQDDIHPSSIERSPTEAVSYAADQAIKLQDTSTKKITGAKRRQYPEIILKGANFKYGSTALTPESSKQLQRITTRLKERASINVEIAGYTDATEDTHAVNQSISQLRSETVKDYFVSNGIEVRRLTAKGYGSKSPIASNTTLQGREQNRRVEIHIK